MVEAGYKVRLEGSGLTLEREVPKSVGEQIAVLILRGRAEVANESSEQSATAARGTEGSVPRSKGQGGVPRTAPREFLAEHQPKRGPDKITVLGVYMKRHDGKDSFSAGDLRKAFESAAESVPGNLGRDINWTVKAGWIAPKSGARGAYYVTNGAEDAVDRKFPSDLVKKTRIQPNS